MVNIWSGSGYALDSFCVGADSAEEALEKAVVLAERDGRGYLFQDDIVDILTDDEVDELLLYVYATMEGARSPHYIFNENLQIYTI